MNIVYSHHAKRRLRQRGIAEFEVVDILQSPIELRHSLEGLEIAVGESNKRLIKVVFSRKESYIKVVTIV